MPKEPKEPIVLTAADVLAAPPTLIRAGIETTVAAYIEQLGAGMAKPSVKLCLMGCQMLVFET
jgi:hypothetical protein